MVYKVTKEMAKALDCLLDSYNKDINQILWVHTLDTPWRNDLKPLNALSVEQLARYLIEGYEAEKDLQEKVDDFIQWAKNLPSYDVQSKIARQIILKAIHEFELIEKEN